MLARDTVSKLLAALRPPRYVRAPVGSVLDPFEDWICDNSMRMRRRHEARTRACGKNVARVAKLSVIHLHHCVSLWNKPVA